jgi:hypothetical protein
MEKALLVQVDLDSGLKKFLVVRPLSPRHDNLIPYFGKTRWTSTPRSTAVCKACSIGSSGIKYGVVILICLRAAWIRATMKRWLFWVGKSGPLAKAWIGIDPAISGSGKTSSLSSISLVSKNQSAAKMYCSSRTAGPVRRNISDLVPRRSDAIVQSGANGYFIGNYRNHGATIKTRTFTAQDAGLLARITTNNTEPWYLVGISYFGLHSR